MGFFDIDYDILIWQLLPVRLRKPLMHAWLRCLATPVKWLYSLFSASRATHLYTLAHNSQVVYLQSALNDLFDNTGRGIYIADGTFEDPLFAYLVPEDKPLWLALVSEVGATTYTAPLSLYTDGETALLGIGFIVMVPASVSFDVARMRALIDRYRLVGRSNYDIVVY